MRIAGPDAQARARLPTWVWGEARTADGQIKTARVQTANGYEVTVHGALLAVRHLLARGYFTPSALRGARCVEQLPGSGRIVLE